MRELTPEQIALVQSLKTDEYKAMQLQAQEDLRKAQASYEVKQAEYLARAAAEEARRLGQLKPIIDALRAAGIKISVEAYCYGSSLWVKAELPDGTKVDEEFDELNTEETT